MPASAIASLPGLRSVTLAAVACALAACHHDLRSKATGDASVRFIEPTPITPAAAAAAFPIGEPVDAVTPARPAGPLANPAFPREAFVGKAGFATVAVRLTIGTTGRVIDIQPSLRPIATFGPHADAFRRAVEDAVAQWRFQPAERHVVVRQRPPNGEDEYVIQSGEPTEWIVEAVFTFSEKGDVTANLRH